MRRCATVERGFRDDAAHLIFIRALKARRGCAAVIAGASSIVSERWKRQGDTMSDFENCCRECGHECNTATWDGECRTCEHKHVVDSCPECGVPKGENYRKCACEMQELKEFSKRQMREFEMIRYGAEARALSSVSLKRPLTKEEFKRFKAACAAIGITT